MDSLFKIGDYVKVLPREGIQDDYRCGFIDEMAELKGRIFQVTNVRKSEDSEQHFNIPDDGYIYALDSSCWNWSSGMLGIYTSPVEKTESKEVGKATFSVGTVVQILPRKGRPEDYTNSYVKPMESYVGRWAVITSIKKPLRPSDKEDDGYEYHLDIDAGHWCWNSTMFKRVRAEDKLECEKPSTPEEASSSVLPKIETSYRKYKLNFNI